jgi:putative SOS response-associated peptidase YedK
MSGKRSRKKTAVPYPPRRRPVILSPGDYDAWLNPAEQDSSKLAYMFEPPAGAELATSAVDPIINNARNEGPEYFEEIE